MLGAVEDASRCMHSADEGRLTDDELRLVRPILGEIDPDVVSRWLATSQVAAPPRDGQGVLQEWVGRRATAINEAGSC